MSKKISYSILLVSAVIMTFTIISSSCGEQKVFKNIVYDGVLVDSLTHPHPAGGKTLLLKACQTGEADKNLNCYCSTFVLGTTVTNADGSFHFKVKAPRNGIYYFISLSPSNTDFNDRYRCLEKSDLMNNCKQLYIYY